MTRAALVLRPEPGNRATADRLAAMGVPVLRQPLFAVSPVPWGAPDPERFDAVVLTSANAVRHGGPGLAALARLPFVAVGEATAAAARAAGLQVALTGKADAVTFTAAARQRGFARLLHIAGRDRTAVPGVEAVAVYASEAIKLAPGLARTWEGTVALLHSVRAARRFAALADRDGVDRGSVSVAALSAAVRDAAGVGWERSEAAAQPNDAALVALALALIDPLDCGVDKRLQ